MDIVNALTEADARLPAQERRIAAVIRADVDFAINAPITELAARAGVAPATVTRFCRRLGCEGYADFRVQLARAAMLGLRYILPEVPAVTPAAIAEDVLARAQGALVELQRGLDLSALSAAAGLIARARMVHAFGAGGNSSMIASELQNRLFRLGLPVSASSDHAMNLMLAAAAGEGTVILGSSFSGRNAELLRCLEVARGRGVKVIALTQAGSPVAAAADIVLDVTQPEGANIFRPSATRFAMLAMLDILATLVAHADEARALKSLRAIKETLVRHRDGDDRQLLGD